MQPVAQRIGVRQSVSRLLTAGLLAAGDLIILLFAVWSDANTGALSLQPAQLRLFLPSVIGPPLSPEESPAGTHSCEEHEFGVFYGGSF